MSLDKRRGGAELKSSRAWAHPLRLRIMSLLTGVELSAAEVARELAITQANASYHLRRLADAGELEVSDVVKVRGGLAKKYRYVARTDSASREWGATTEQSQARMQQLRQALDAELRRRIPLVSNGPALFADAEVWLAPEDVARARALLHEASMLVHDRAQPPRTDGTDHVSFVTWIFRMDRADEAR